MLDLLRTPLKTADFGQLKETIENALKDHEHTHDIQVTGLQRRVGAEHSKTKHDGHASTTSGCRRPDSKMLVCWENSGTPSRWTGSTEPRCA